MKADSFTTISSVGGLLPPDTLASAAEGRNLPGLEPVDYHLIEGETVRTAANRAWTRLTTAWTSFRVALEASPKDDAATSLTRDKWLQVLFSELGYGRLATTPTGGLVVDATAYPVSHIWGSVPIHLIGAGVPLDRRTRGVAGAATRAPHSMMQELLNRSDKHLWGIISNGRQLRLLRDNASLVRAAYVEFDLEALFDGEVFSDFIVLYLVCHESRLETDPIVDCWLERWRAEAVATGTRALDALRDGVTEALRTFGKGFLRHPNNAELREALAEGTLEKQDYYRALLRLVYRLLFVFVAEDRGSLLQPGSDPPIPEARRRYATFFSTHRLRTVATRRRGTRHDDLWQGLRLIFDALGSDQGCPELALPSLGGLFDPHTLGIVERCLLSNESLLQGVRSLSQITQDGTTRTIDFRNLGAEELGSVYESLLELSPQHDPATHDFELTILGGNERKTTGSYYTPASLIDCLLDNALEPVLEHAMRSESPEQALLNLTVCDPACGSGHFLVAAARRIARRLAGVRTGEAEPTPDAIRSALRDVVGRCIYGVDLNDLAAELAKVSLWLETLEPGKPLSFLDAHIKVGNSLLGVTPTMLSAGLPDQAFDPLIGDDKKMASSLKRRNSEQRRGQRELFGGATMHLSNASLAEQADALKREDDSTAAGVRRKADAWRRMEDSRELARSKLHADAWCASFVWPETSTAPPIPTHAFLAEYDPVSSSLPDISENEVRRLARAYRFFHWHLEFPEVFRVGEAPHAEGPGQGWTGGFSCVLGNPPWDRIKFQEKEWFLDRRPDIASATNAAARRRLIAELENSDSALYSTFTEAQRKAEGEGHLIRHSGRFPLCGRGDANTYALFAELKCSIISPQGRLGTIVPSGIATDDTTKFFFHELMNSSTLALLYDFENRAGLFPAVDSRYKFSLMVVTGNDMKVTEGAELVFFAHTVKDLNDPDRRLTLTSEDVALLNPNSRTCPIFRNKRDADISKDIYNRIPILQRQGPVGHDPWGVRFLRMFDMTTDADLFRTREDLEADGARLEGRVFRLGDEIWLPVFEGKMVGMYDHRAASIAFRSGNELRQQQPVPTGPTERADPAFLNLPYLWAPKAEARSRTPDVWKQAWFPVFKRVTSSTNERTAIGCVIPWTAVSYTLFAITCAPETQDVVTGLAANLWSFVCDYLLRQKTAQPSLPIGVVYETPILPPETYRRPTSWEPSESLMTWIEPRVLELSYSALDLSAFAADLRDFDKPFIWNADRRTVIRAELDAAFFHLYGVERKDADYILDTFPIVRRKEEALYGEFRSKRLILECFDEMAKAVDGGSPFQTELDPPAGQGPRHSIENAIGESHG